MTVRHLKLGWIDSITGPPNVTCDPQFSGLSSEPRGSGMVGKGRRAQVPDKPPHPHPTHPL